ncbi:F-box/RNI-like superfamily protein [Euphorbia peplus]|nr:F-box/RNI-like superfamily protein [Euphorbia peplus]
MDSSAARSSETAAASSETADVSSETAARSSEPKGRKTITEDADFISKLPEDLLRQLLSYFSLREAVRTSVLSWRWRYVSADKPVLQFNWQQMFFTETKDYEFWKSHKNPCIISSKKIVEAISDYVRFYRGDKINLFEVNFCFCTYNREYMNFWSGIKRRTDDSIDGWIKFALEKGVESLTLFAYCLFGCCRNTNCGRSPLITTRGCGFDYLFKTELFDGIAVNLKHLKLSSCELGANFTHQLSLLETIRLHNVDNLAINLEGMLPFLEKLKTLEITNSALPKKLSLATLPLLQKFSTSTDRQSSLEEIELSNPNLIEFKCLSLSHSGVNCNLSGAPNLTSLSYTVPFLKMDSVFIDYPRQCPEVRKLTLFIVDNWVNWALPRSVVKFSRVTDLNLNLQSTFSDFSLVRVMAILKAFPLLRRFLLMMNCAEDMNEEEPELTYVPEYLTEITIPKFSFTPKQMKFAIYLLENASALEKMTLLPRSGRKSSAELEARESELISRLREVDYRNILGFV